MRPTFMNIDAEKRKAVIEAAVKEFGSYGFHNASTNRLIKTLGISKGSLFKYFRSKLELYAYITDVVVKKLIEYMDKFEALEENSAIENIVSYAEFEYDFLMKYPDEYLFFYKMSKEIHSPELIVIKENLTNKALFLSEKLYQAIGIADDKELFMHLNLILNAYNIFFLENADSDDWYSLKDHYLSGLRKHLSFVKWR